MSKPEFKKLLDKLKEQQTARFETRAFMYLDIISWLESKIEGVPVKDVRRRKFLASLRGADKGNVKKTEVA